MNQNPTYGPSRKAIINRGINSIPTNSTRHLRQQEAALSKEEKEILAMLMRVEGDSPWANMIRKIVCKNVVVRQYRMLIQELYTEGMNKEDAMERIIGNKTWQSIKDLVSMGYQGVCFG